MPSSVFQDAAIIHPGHPEWTFYCCNTVSCSNSRTVHAVTVVPLIDPEHNSAAARWVPVVPWDNVLNHDLPPLCYLRRVQCLLRKWPRWKNLPDWKGPGNDRGTHCQVDPPGDCRVLSQEWSDNTRGPGTEMVLGQPRGCAMKQMPLNYHPATARCSKTRWFADIPATWKLLWAVHMNEH